MRAITTSINDGANRMSFTKPGICLALSICGFFVHSAVGASWRDGLDKAEQQAVLTMLEQSEHVKQHLLSNLQTKMAQVEKRMRTEQAQHNESGRNAAATLRTEYEAYQKLIRTIKRNAILLPPIWFREPNYKYRPFETGDVIWCEPMTLRQESTQPDSPLRVPLLWADRLSLDGTKLYITKSSYPIESESIKPDPNQLNWGKIDGCGMVLVKKKLIKQYGQYQKRWVAEPLRIEVKKAFEQAQRQKAASNATAPQLLEGGSNKPVNP